MDKETERLLRNLFEDWRTLIERRIVSDGPERQELDDLYNRLLPDICKISRSWVNPDVGLICTVGRLLQDFFLGKLLPDIADQVILWQHTPLKQVLAWSGMRGLAVLSTHANIIIIA